MAAFIAKQVVGKQLESVKGVLGDKEAEKEKEKKGEGGDDDDDDDEEAIAEERREEEARRKEKHRKMEEERETMRQEIRDKYGIKKKESPVEDVSLDGRLGRKGKGHAPDSLPSPSSASGSCKSPDAESRGFPKNLDDLTAKMKEIPERMMSTVTDASDKCKMQ